MIVLVSLALASTADCPATPALRDDDEAVTVLSQNLKFIATGGQKSARAEMLAAHLDADRAVDLLLLSEARAVAPLRDALDDWCLYTQAGTEDAYRWSLGGASPAGLVLGVRSREEGLARSFAAAAGRVFRAKALTFAEGFLGPIAGFEKGWAVAEVDGTRLVWTHTQASYARSPLLGAGGPGRGRAGQLGNLADDLGSGSQPTLLTGDLNVLDGMRSDDAEMAAAGDKDAWSLADFARRTGIRFPTDRGPCPEGSFLGGLRGLADGVFRGAALDRVGTNAAFDAAHPGTAATCERIEAGGLSVSDHLGVRVHAPFARR